MHRAPRQAADAVTLLSIRCTVCRLSLRAADFVYFNVLCIAHIALATWRVFFGFPFCGFRIIVIIAFNGAH